MKREIGEIGCGAREGWRRWHIWILDVGGTRVVVLTQDYARTTAAELATMQAIVDSIQFE
jgi:hypothetical protein